MFVELHVEQGRDLVDRGRRGRASRRRAGRTAAGASTSAGEPNHAGATRMEDRHDPMLTYAMTALAANKQARLADARATFGRVSVEPNATNAIPSLVQALAGRARRRTPTRSSDLVGDDRPAGDRAGRPRRHQRRGHGRVGVARPSTSTSRSTQRLAATLGGVPVIPTGAGHDAAHPAAGRHPVGDALRAQPDRRSRTRPRSSPRWPTAWPASTRSPPCSQELAGVTTYWCEHAVLRRRRRGAGVLVERRRRAHHVGRPPVKSAG